MENKTSLQRFKELYGFREGIIDYIPQAGELLKYIGDHVILLIYKRNDKPVPIKKAGTRFINIRVFNRSLKTPKITFGVRYIRYVSIL